VYNRRIENGKDRQKEIISIEVRSLIIAAHDYGMGLKDIMKTFHVKKAAVYNLFELVA
jgi:predicted AlkP superfamily pyrophosphatase or phosphodiesterase